MQLTRQPDHVAVRQKTKRVHAQQYRRDCDAQARTLTVDGQEAPEVLLVIVLFYGVQEGQYFEIDGTPKDCIEGVQAEGDFGVDVKRSYQPYFLNVLK